MKTIEEDTYNSREKRMIQALEKVEEAVFDARMEFDSAIRSVSAKDLGKLFAHHNNGKINISTVFGEVEIEGFLETTFADLTEELMDNTETWEDAHAVLAGFRKAVEVAEKYIRDHGE